MILCFSIVCGCFHTAKPGWVVAKEKASSSASYVYFKICSYYILILYVDNYANYHIYPLFSYMKMSPDILEWIPKK